MSLNFDSNETHDVKIEDVKPLEKHINVVFKVHERGEEREISTRAGESHRVCDFTVADETACITLTLWNEDIDAVQDKKVYKLSNGFANVFQNSLRLSKGKFGQISEDSTIFDDVNSEKDRSSEHVEDPRRRTFRKSYDSNRSSGGYNRSSGDFRSRRRDDRSSGRRNRW